MIGLLQRVTEAEVIIKGETTAAIGPGLMVLIVSTAVGQLLSAT